MIDAGGLGNKIIRAISRPRIGCRVEAGPAVVLLTTLTDRLTKEIDIKFDPGD